jgi:hypothetical protein
MDPQPHTPQKTKTPTVPSAPKKVPQSKKAKMGGNVKRVLSFDV